MNILDVSFFIISSIIRMGKSTVCNNFQQFYILGHPNAHEFLFSNLNTPIIQLGKKEVYLYYVSLPFL